LRADWRAGGVDHRECSSLEKAGKRRGRGHTGFLGCTAMHDVTKGAKYCFTLLSLAGRGTLQVG
jgi:hypothetical protein